MQPEELKLYELYLAKIKETDEISFKLMGLVPLISGAGVFGLLKGDVVFSNNSHIDFFVFWLIGIFGALITFFIFRWELRNIATCRTFRKAASSFENANGPYKTLSDPAQSTKLMGRRFGKSEAEKAIYIISMLFWILLPLVKTML